nr:ABC transporter substrate-binding protein [uncultured Cellulosilyticum sp.]
MKMKNMVAIVLGFMMSMSVVGCGTREVTSTDNNSDTIKIGLLTPKTGKVAQYGINVENAAKLAIDEVNAAGGINGKQVELIAYDNKGDATESINLFKRLVDNDKVVAVVGPVISSTALAVAPLAEEKGIPVITPTATNVDVTLDSDYMFRACFTDPYQGGIMSKFATENLKAQTAAILYNSGDDYSTGLAEAFKENFEAAGGIITDYEAYTEDEKDFKAVLTNMKANSPDVLYVPDYYNTVGLIAEQVKQVGLEVTMLGADGWDDVQKDYGSVTEGYYFTNHYAADDTDEIVQKFVTSYQDTYEGNTPNALGALGYDATKIMCHAIDEADSTDGEAIVKALSGTDMDCVAGHVTFDENGDPQKAVTILTIKDGKLVFETKVQP